jgi:hypothetical protein
MLCGFVATDRRFNGAWCLHHQGVLFAFVTSAIEGQNILPAKYKLTNAEGRF